MIPTTAFNPQPYLAVPSNAPFDHIVVIVLENKDLNQIYGSGQAPFLTNLADTYSLAQHYTGIDHPSEPNYLAMFSGLAGDCASPPPNIGGCMTAGGNSTSDCSPNPTGSCWMGNTVNLVDRLEAAGLTWDAYLEGSSGGCDRSFGTAYHAGFLFFADINTPTRCARIHSFSATSPTNLIAQLNSGGSNLIWINPDNSHNMHDNSVAIGDTYMSTLIPQILSSTTFTTTRAVLFVTFDEGNRSYPTDYIYTVFAGPAAKTRYKSTVNYTQYSFLKTLETAWALPSMQSTDANAAPMTEFFAPPGSTPLLASFSFTPSTSATSQTVSFTAIAAGGAPPYSYTWTFGDGTTGTGASTTHAYTTAGTYAATVTVRDSSSPQQIATGTNSIVVTLLLTGNFGVCASLPQGWNCDNTNGLTGSSVDIVNGVLQTRELNLDAGNDTSYYYATSQKGTFPWSPCQAPASGVLPAGLTSVSSTFTPVSLTLGTSGTRYHIYVALYYWLPNGGIGPQNYSCLDTQVRVESIDGMFSSVGSTATYDPGDSYGWDQVMVGSVSVGQTYTLTADVADQCRQVLLAWGLPSNTVCQLAGIEIGTEGYRFQEVDVNFVNVQLITSAPPALSSGFTFSPSSPTAGQNVAFTSTMTGGTTPYTYSWNFGDGGSSAAQNPAHSYSSTGTYTITLTVKDSGSPQQTSTSTKTVTVAPRDTSTTQSCPASGTVGVVLTCSATVADSSPGTTSMPTGTVTFTPSGACALVSGSCSVNVTPTTTGTLSVSASYDGDSLHSASSGSASLTVNKRNTSTTVTCPATGTIGVALTCSASVTDTSLGTTSTPSGTVTFALGGICTLSSSSCSVSMTPTASGSLSVSASYSGDSSHNSSSGTSNIITIAKRNTATTVTCTPPSISLGQQASCTGTVTDTSPGTKGTPTGSVTFASNGAGSFSGTCALNASGSCTTSVSYTPSGSVPRTDTITGSYGGDTVCDTSLGTFALFVTSPPLVTGFTLTPTSPTTGQAVTFTATASGGTPPYTYSWNFGDSSTGTGSPVSHTYSSAGSFSATLTVEDATLTSKIVTQTVNVVSTLNNPPALTVPGPQTVNEGTAITFTVSATDPDTGQSVTLTAWELPPGATFTASSGQFSWVPNESQGPGDYALTFAATDNGSPVLWDTKSVAITVNEVNLAPNEVVPGARTVNELVSLSFPITCTDPDLPANALALSASGLPTGATFTPATGQFSWTPDEAQGPGSFFVSFTCTDNGSLVLSDTKSVAITVNDVNVAPVLTVPGAQTVNELVPLTFTISATDIDIPANPITLDCNDCAALGGTFNAAMGQLSWTPSESQGPGDYTLTFTATDNGSPQLSDTRTVTIHVNEVNSAPVVFVPGAQTVNEGTAITFIITASDSDTPANTLTLSSTSLPSGASLDPATGVFLWTPSESRGPGDYTITFSAADNGFPPLSDTKTVTVHVNEVNQPPVLPPVPALTVNELTSLTFPVSAADPDVPAQTLTFTLSGNVPGATLDPSTGNFTWTPTEAEGPGVYLATVTVTDSDGLSASQSFQISVFELNTPPALSVPEPQSVTVNSTLAFIISATDPDVPGNLVTLTASGLVNGMSFDGSSGTFSFKPGSTQAGSTFTVTFTAADDGVPSLSDTKTVNITVSTRPPITLSTPSAQFVDENTTLSFTVSAVGDHSQTILLSCDSCASLGAQFTSTAGPGSASGIFAWTPTEAQGPGTFTIALAASDGFQTASTTVTVNVNEVNTAPILSLPGTLTTSGTITAREGDTVRFVVTGTDPDIPTNTITLSASGLPQGASFDTETGTFYWNLQSIQPGVYTVTFTATDNGTPPISDAKTLVIHADRGNGRCFICELLPVSQATLLTNVWLLSLGGLLGVSVTIVAVTKRARRRLAAHKREVYRTY